METEQIKKPPLGLIPRWVRDEQRINEISEACDRYSKAGITIPNDWIEETKEIYARMKKRKDDKEAKTEQSLAPEPEI